MAFPTKDTFTFDFEAQTDYPNWTPAETKEHMNERGEELRIALNAVANLLNATTSDASGADNTGIPETIVGSGTNVRDRADWLYAQIVAAVLGAIPDGSLATIKYADGSVTAAKVAADVATQAELDDLAGVNRTTETVKGVSDSLGEHQVEDATDAHTPKNVGISVTTAGDMLYATGVNTIARLAKGTARQQLAMNGGATAPEWVTSLQSLMTAEGDMIYASTANTPEILAKGTALQRLRMNTGATAPEWVDSEVAWVKIADTVLTATAAQVDFIIPSGYKTLKIMQVAKNSATQNSYVTNIRFNDDSAANYLDNGVAASQITFPSSLPATASPFNICIMEILNLATCIKNTLSWGSTGTAAPTFKAESWNNVVAEINKISLINSGLTFAIGSNFSVWGCK